MPGGRQVRGAAGEGGGHAEMGCKLKLKIG